MKVSVKVSESGHIFGQPTGGSTHITIEAHDFEAAQATVSAVTLLASLGAGEMVVIDDPDVGTTAEAEPAVVNGEPLDDVPAAGWSPDPSERVSNPGDLVRLVWPDGGSRLFVDSGTQWVAPAVAGRFAEPMSVEFDDPNVTAHLIATQPGPGEPAPEA